VIECLPYKHWLKVWTLGPDHLGSNPFTSCVTKVRLANLSVPQPQSLLNGVMIYGTYTRELS
jgi:hypothetical protein